MNCSFVKLFANVSNDELRNAKLSRNIKFQIFDTYYVKDDFYSGREKFTVKELKDKESTDILIGKIFDYIKHKNLEKNSIHESLSFLLKKVERLNLFYKINNQ